MFLLSALSAESKKETNSLRPLRLRGDYKLQYDTVSKNTCKRIDISIKPFELGAEMRIDIVEFAIDDYDQVITLWGNCDGIALSGADSKDNIRTYLERNPGMSFVAKHEGTVIGAALSGHDGRRGYIHHLAVYSDYRHQGIGRAMVDRCILSLQTAGIQKCHLFVLKDNQKGIQFWEHMGWARRFDLEVISRTIGAQS